MTRASFTSLKLGDPDVFAVKIEGHLGARERARVEELVRKCREKQKTQVVLDLSGLESMGGGVAAVLGEFAAEMAHAGHTLLLAGASDVVQGFLTARFTAAPPVFVDSLPLAEAVCVQRRSGAPTPASPPPASAPTPTPQAPRPTATTPLQPEPALAGQPVRRAPQPEPALSGQPAAGAPQPATRASRPPAGAAQSATAQTGSRPAGRSVAEPASPPPSGERSAAAPPSRTDAKPAARPASERKGSGGSASGAGGAGRSAAAKAAGRGTGKAETQSPPIILLPDQTQEEAAAPSQPPPKDPAGRPAAALPTAGAPASNRAPAGPGPTTAATPALDVAPRSAPGATPGAGQGQVPPARYVSLEEALRMCAKSGSLPAMRQPIADMLHGADLASVCLLFGRERDRLIETQERKLSFPADGAIAATLIAQGGPVAMIDLGGDDLGDAEADLLTALNCQIAVPLFGGGALRGALFLRKDMPGSEYGPGEMLALDLLAQRIGGVLGGEAGRAPAPHASGPRSRGPGSERRAEGGEPHGELEAHLRRKIYQQKALLGISRDFNSTQDEERLINLLLLTAIGQVGSGSVAYFEIDGKGLRPRASRGLEGIELPCLPAPSPDALGAWNEPATASPPPAGALKDLMQKLAALGLQVAAPVRSKLRTFGILALGPRIAGSAAEYDAEFLSILLNQTGIALENARLFHELEDRTLGVARTFVSLIEKRNGQIDRASTELVTYYVGKIAQAMSFPPERYRDLLYGAVLRDIGMIEISDLVLRSPRSLTHEEWRLIKQHPASGMEILGSMGFNIDITGIVLHHHERFNGEGYPHGLRGAAIPQGARIVSVAESFVAMTRNLPYRAALGWGESLEVMRENWGMRYDPAVLEAFLSIVETEGERKAMTPEVVHGR